MSLREHLIHSPDQGWQVSAISGLNWFKPSWQKQVSATFLPKQVSATFLPKHNKCSNILEKSTHFYAEHTQTGHHLLSIQPGLMYEYV